MHVLVTNDSFPQSLGIVRSLGRKGIRVSVLADKPTRLASHSRYCSARYEVPPPGEDSFYSAVMNLLHRIHFDLIIPVGYDATRALAQHQVAVNSLSSLEIADSEKIQRAADKRYVNELASEVGVPAPKSFSPTHPNEVRDLSRGIKYPVVIKAASEPLVKKGVQYARTPHELIERYEALWQESKQSPTPPPIVQEYIPGFGCGFFALYQKGTCKRIFMHRRVREVPPSGGISCCAESYYDPKLKEYGTRLLDQLGWHGVAMVEFRYDTDVNDYKLVEINPKFWGSLDLALAAGVDFPYYLCQMAQGQTIEYSEEYIRKIRFHWPLLETLHILQRPAAIGTVLVDSLSPRVRSNLAFTDIMPNLFEPAERLRSQLSRRIRQRRQSRIALAALGKSRP
ncbi:MAG TPA: ATP-grasp domain-containing protein [Terriglobia bacterium]|nr:ATP-grasp domain-containing protein [Terriglobia bacterium]